MTKVYNIEDSYVYYRKELLKKRLEIVRPLSNTRLRVEYDRLPIKIIERLEKENNIIPEVADPTVMVYLSIVSGYIKFLMKKVFLGYNMRLGARLGVITIRGTKITPKIGKDGRIIGVVPSWSKTKEKWTKEASDLGLTFKEYIEEIPKEKRKLVYCLNEHTDYIRYNIRWIKRNVVVKNKSYYSLSFNRVNKRLVWKYAIEGREYIISENKN